MYLKRLELHGFKSFAARTDLEYAPGITAVVGPNGSGKSNVADAVRWVLGEQSMRHLRGKKSEDIIFAGAQGKAAMGMAEVSLYLDNSAGWLPSEYTEVKITRRSYRSGENEYLINNNKVRLKDLLLLLSQARIGHDSYTVVGQGLIDAALSLRAEERRALFEDAAGIRHFQAQRDDAENKLELTEQNLGRLHDILAEIEPRLAPLAEQARRAREYAAVQADYQSRLSAWYTQQWQRLQDQQQRAEEVEAERSAELARVQAELGAREESLRELRGERERAAAQMNSLRRARGELMSRMQTLERDVAVAEERLGSLTSQSGELALEQEQQRQQVAAAEQRITTLQQQIDDLADQLAQGDDAIQQMERSVASLRQRQEQEDARLRAAQRDVIQIQTRLGASQSELGRLQKQLGEKNRTLATRRETQAQSQQKLEAAQTKLEGQQRLLTDAQREEEQLAARRQELAQAVSEGQNEQEQLREALGDARRERRSVSDRLALLREWRSNLSGYGDGVRTLLQAPAGKIPQMLGTVAQLVSAPEGMEAALEAALGPLLQAIVVRSADDAMACLDYLRSVRGGRALLVWVSEAGNLASASDSEESVDNAKKEPTGPLGSRAAALVSSPPEYRGLFRRLLGDAVIVESLETAGQYLEVATEGQSGNSGIRRVHGPAEAMVPQRIVTIAGEVLHVQGWLSGGQEAGESQGLLERERELRELPAQLEQHDTTIGRLEAVLEQARQAQEARKQELAAREREAQQVATRIGALNREVQSLRQIAERALSELQVGRSVEEQLAGEVAGLEQELAAAQARVAEQESALRDANERAEDVQEEVEQHVRQFREKQDELNRQRTALAVKRQEEKALAQNLEQQRAQMRESGAQMKRRAERLAEMEQQAQSLKAQVERQQAELEQVRTQAREAGAHLREAEEQAAEFDRQLLELERGQSSLRQDQARLEVEYRRCLLEVQRSRDALEALLQQMQEELDINDPALLAERAHAENSAVAAESDPAALRRQIESLRARLKELSNHDPNAPQEYEEARERYEYLTSQVQDMESAAANLRHLIGELDITMKRQFEETFHAVNERFGRHFTTLFRGGAAHLELTAPKDEERNGPAGGIEVMVQPPGKKVQDLSLLSGGERALVSAALLFALLETNPPPFCLLDEVDAALDESNVVRFCDILKALSERTQFIVITHNRVTMTAAGAIYGVSMGADSVSRILSTRLAAVG
ncbi:MAG TPA: chromosome segregation protein SMC [Ktedonobacterales bacterium]|nr:chromosome segregation protein SMC [Ktedonobacterales bacterium]